MAKLTVDDSSFQRGIDEFLRRAENNKMKALNDVADEVLRLSSREVPHDTGELQNSAEVEQGFDEVTVGYNKVYAARLHEHPEYNFQKGRKGKYLEDPIKNNLRVFREYIVKSMGEGFQ